MIISFIRLTVPIYCNFCPEFECLPKPWTQCQFLHEIFFCLDYSELLDNKSIDFLIIISDLMQWRASGSMNRWSNLLMFWFWYKKNVTQGHGWKLNRTSYYQEGWLAAGNLKSVIGVTFTSTLSQRSASWASSPTALPLPPRTNYNLRGHRAQVIYLSQFLSFSIGITLRCFYWVVWCPDSVGLDLYRIT